MTTVGVIGLGYTGLPLANQAATAGMRVIGIDEDRAVTAALQAGCSPVPDVSDHDVRRLLDQGFQAYRDAEPLAEASVVVICVPTPLDSSGAPDLDCVRRATRSLGHHLKPGTLVVLESTSFPGTTDEVVRPLLEEVSGLRAGPDFSLAFSPERVDPGNRTYGVANTPRVVGGHTAECTAVAVRFFGRLCERVVPARSTREAELAKLLENTYRSVNIALVNELAVAARRLGVDVWDAIDCAGTKPFGFQTFHPGPGVGGHCIPVDPSYLAHRAREAGSPLRLVELAQAINDAMPHHVLRRAGEVLRGVGRDLAGSRVLLVGVTYKRDCPDLRGTPAAPLVHLLREAGATVAYHDPLVDRWRPDGEPVAEATDLWGAAARADLTVLLQDHGVLPVHRLPHWSRQVLDTRGRLRGTRAHQL